MSHLTAEDISATPCPIRSHSPDFLKKSKVIPQSKPPKKSAAKQPLPATSFPLIAQSDIEDDDGDDLDDPTEFVELTGVVQYDLRSLGTSGQAPTVQQVCEGKAKELEKLRKKRDRETIRDRKTIVQASTEEARELLRAPPKRRATVHQNKVDEQRDAEKSSTANVAALSLPGQEPLETQIQSQDPLPTLPDFGTILKPQPQYIRSRTSLMGGGVRRPQLHAKRRISTFLEAKRRERAEKEVKERESLRRNEEISPKARVQYGHVKRNSADTRPERNSYNGKVYDLKAPPKRVPVQTTAKSTLHDEFDKTKLKEKENLPTGAYYSDPSSACEMICERSPSPIHSTQEKAHNHSTSASLLPRKALGDKKGTEGIKAASISIDDKERLNKQKLQHMKPSQGLVKKNVQTTARKRPSSPLQLLPELDDRDLFSLPDAYPNRSSTSLNSSWDASSPAPQHGPLRLIKRRKISVESTNSMSEAQIAFAQQLAARHQRPRSDPKKMVALPNPGFKAKETIHPVLPENIAQTQMYESEITWLVMLESSVTELINAIFASYESSEACAVETHLQLRREMLRIYSSPPFPLLYKRLQASLAFGALSVPKELILKSSAVRCWGEDLGLKKQFVDLFLGTYEVEVLGIGLEVVIGRQLFQDGKAPHSVPNSGVSNDEGRYITTMSEKEKIKLVEGFLERYFVNCEDAYLNPPMKAQGTSRLVGALTGKVQQGKEIMEEDWGTVAWGLRKSILRALLLVLLLDKTKTQESSLLGRKCLFRKVSKYKSSAAVLHALAGLLLPSLGDILRPLSHVSYVPEYVQYPLEEYSYHIENLAVDMRDGVRLNRLVELLLFSEDCYRKKKEAKWPLSRNLKFPAVGRAMRIYNVEIALKALDNAGGNEGGVRAEDIVDGFRERTVGLLWRVVGRWALEMGIGGLVNWNQLRDEIKRLAKKDGRLLEEEDEGEEESEYIGLLKMWAKCIARKKGVLVDNLTTSFADGKAFEAIIEEYGTYFGKKAIIGEELPLNRKLRELGCSAYFANLFCSSTRSSHIYSRDFIISTLSFLCSRLLNWSIRERAATMIQRAFRSYHFAKTAHKRIILQLKEKVVNAVILIQRVFRGHLRRKIGRLLKAVIGIQCCARGWIARREAWSKGWAVRKIQEWWKGVGERRFRRRIQVANEALIPLQAVARGVVIRRSIDKYKIAVEIVEREWSRLLAGKRARKKYFAITSAALAIQNWWRSVILTKDARGEYLRTRVSVVNLQAQIRGLLVRKFQQEQLSAVVTIQRTVRSARKTRLSRLHFTETLWAAYVVQTRRRTFVVARAEREKYLELKAYAIALQRLFREKKAVEKAVAVIQRAWRKFKWVVRMRRIIKEVVLIQSFWRGCAERKRSSPRLRLIRRRLAKGAMKGEETLGAKTEKAIGLLKGPATFTRGVLMLEGTTTYSIESMTTVASSAPAITALTNYIEAMTKQLQKSSMNVPPRNLLLVANLLRRLSMNTKSRMAIFSNAGSEKQVFSSLLLLLETLGNRPPPQAELFLTAVSILLDLTKDEAFRAKVVAQKKWVRTLEGVFKMEKGRDNEQKGIRGGNSSGGKSKVERMEILLGLVRGRKGSI